MKEIEIIKKNYKEIFFVFNFYDRFAVKLQQAAVPEKNKNTLVFYDYYDDKTYYVPVERINLLLDYCYGEYFFKIVLTGCSYYQKVKTICDDLEIEPPVYDLFFRSYFLAIKELFNSKVIYSSSDLRNLVRRFVFRSHEDAFDNFPLIDMENYIKKSEKILKKLEDSGLLFYNSNDITRDKRIQCYFPISCDTFKFAITESFDGYGISMPMFDYLDLKTFLDSQSHSKKDLLTVMDRTVQTLVIMSFNDVKFKDNEFSDNSFIRQLRLAKKKRYA